MSETVRYTIGAGVRCADGECGSLTRVVIDPILRSVTHLVVDPGQGEDRLVPVSLLGGDSDDMLLTCGREAFEALESAEVEQFLPGDGNDLGYDPGQMVMWPFFGSAIGVAGMSPSPFSTAGTRQERIPAGEVQIRRGDHVAASDGEAGRVHGLIVDEDHTVTDVLLSEGHLWGKKTVAVPITGVDRAGSTIRVPYTKDQLKDLPDVDLTPQAR